MSQHPFVRSSSVLLLLASAAIAQITPGNLIVVRSGDGTAALTNAATLMFLDQYDRVTAAQPTPITTTSMPVTISGSATSEGFVTQSVDGNYLVAVGYNVSAGTLTVANTAATVVGRAIARVALNGTIDASTVLTDTYSGSASTAGNIRSASTVDGSAFWTSGTGLATANRGVCYAVLGGTTAVQLSTAPTNVRVGGLANGQIYCSTSSSPFIGVSAVGTGLSTTAGQTTTLLAGFPGATAGSSQYDFWFADAQTVYVADDRTNGNGGIQKWTESAGTWTLQYTLAVNATTGCRGVSGVRDLAGTHLYATTTQAAANLLVTCDDTGAGATFVTLATAPANTAFRGVRFVRQPSSVTISGNPCPTTVGLPTVGTTGGAPISGNASFGLTVGNTPPFSIYITAISINQFVNAGFPLSLIGGPGCALLYTPTLDILLSGFTDGAGNGLTPLSLAPADASLWGLDLAIQHLILDTTTYGSFSLPFATTEALQIEIGS